MSKLHNDGGGPIRLTPDDLGKVIPGLRCPGCDHEQLVFQLRLVARPVGDFSLAGAQIKFSADEVPIVVCEYPGCGFEEYGQPVEGN